MRFKLFKRKISSIDLAPLSNNISHMITAVSGVDDPILRKEYFNLLKEELKSESIFIKGWRPFIGWVCGMNLLFLTIIVVTHYYTTGELLQMQIANILQMAGSLLGLGTLGVSRTIEKLNGVQDKH